MNLKEMMAEIKAAAQAIVDTAKAENRDLSMEESELVEAKATEYEALAEKLAKANAAAERLAAIAGSSEVVEAADTPTFGKGMGAAFVASGAYQQFLKANPNGVGSGSPIHIEARALMAKGMSLPMLGIGRKATITTDTCPWHDKPVREEGLWNWLPADDDEDGFLSLITTGHTTHAYVEYAQVVGETNGAALVEEGDLKPLSDIETDTQTSKAFTFADGFDITNQALHDCGGLVSFLEARIRRHLRGVIEKYLFNGTGAGTEPTGIFNTTGTLDQPFDTDTVTTIARALQLFQSRNGSVAPQAIVLNPADSWNLRLSKNALGAYQLGNPLQQGLTPTPFGVRTVLSNLVPPGTALIGRFDSIHLLTLDELNVQAFNQHKDYAQRNMVYVRAELRARLVFYNPREVVVAHIGDTSAEGEFNELQVANINVLAENIEVNPAP